MKKQLLAICIAVLSTTCYAQITFEKGYFINNNDEKIECLIKNLDWSNNPTEFKYKLSENSEAKTANIESVKEFNIYNYSKFVRKKVDIDRSSTTLNKLTTNRNPIFNEEELFLKLLVQGELNLYQYKARNLERYFFEKANTNEVEQLVFKSYKSVNGAVGENNLYKQQLQNNVKCQQITPKDIQKVAYRKKDLTMLFFKNNNCNNPELVSLEKQKKRDLFNLNIRPGLKNSSLTINNSITPNSLTEFGGQTGFTLGVEAEFILSFHKNKWAIIVEPRYQNYSAEEELETRNIEVDYQSIQLGIGIRHYIFLNEKSKFFINCSYLRDFQSNSIIVFDPGVDLEISTGQNLGLGIGFKQNDKLSLELNYQTPRGLLGKYQSWYSDYKTVSVIIGYTLF